MAERRKCYKILGLEDGASEDDIRKAYKKLALQYHPDKNSNEDSKGKFQEIGYAYKYLMDGPDTLETSDPHDLREEFLRRVFEDLFFPRFHGGFPFFFAGDDDDDEFYYFQSDSSDDNYYGSQYFHGYQATHGMGTHQKTYTRQTGSSYHPTGSSYHQPSAKQQRKKEKRQRHRERTRENKRKQKEQDRRRAEQVYTDDKNPEPKHSNKPQDSEQQARSSDNKENTDNKSTPKVFPSTKMNKKEKKQLESEQRKREKEMEEIAVELRKKEEQNLQRLKEKEKLAAKREEEENSDSSFIPHFYAQKEKKSRKAQQREKKRQKAAALEEASSMTSKSKPNVIFTSKTQSGVTSNSSRSSSDVKRMSDKVYSTQGTRATYGSRFDVLDDIEDSDEECSKSSQEFTHNSSGFTGRSSPLLQNQASYENTRQQSDLQEPKNENSQVHMNNLHFQRSNINTHESKEDVSFSDSSGMNSNNANQKYANSTCPGKDMDKNGECIEAKDEFVDFDDEEDHKFVENWGECYDEDDIGDGDDVNVYYKGPEIPVENSNLFEKSHNSKNDQYPNRRSHGYHPDNFHHVKEFVGNGNFRGRGFRASKEFIPRARFFHESHFPPSFGGPNNYHRFRGPPPLRPHYFHGNNGMFPRQPHFRRGYPPNHQYEPQRRSNSSHYEGANARLPYNSHTFHRPYRGHSNQPGNKTRSETNSENLLDSKFELNVHYDESAASQYDNLKTENFDDVEDFKKAKFQYRGEHSDEVRHVNSPSRNLFSTKVYYNQARRTGKLDSLDDIEDVPKSTEVYDTISSDPLSGLAQSVSDIDAGIDKFLAKDKLGVPKGMFSDNIKNYYK